MLARGLLSRINRYMLGCKSEFVGNVNVSPLELIDTCWDVNFGVDVDTLAWAVELIDTCWDVNT